MTFWDWVLKWMPEVEKPTAKRLAFNTKLKWTGIILVLYFVLTLIPLYGLGQNALEQFEFLSIILGASFGSIISLGIGPIVTASIVLQLLMGSGLLNIDTSSHDGRQKYQGLQKIMIIGFVLFEAAIYVLMGGLAPSASIISLIGYPLASVVLIGQLCLGGFLIVLMDEVVTKWGFGSGISLFIAAGVASQIFVVAFSWLPSPLNPEVYAGKIPFLVQALGMGATSDALIALVGIIATVIVFLLAVYGQAMKVEIPLSFGRVRGYGMRWPLQFLYTSNIPVILIAAFLANVQLFARLLENWGLPILGTFDSQGNAVSGLVLWVSSPNVVNNLIVGNVSWGLLIQAVGYIAIMIAGSVLFSVMWVKTANMDARSQAEQILKSGLQVPGFRRDPRVMESILNRYIPGLTVMGGALVGFLAAFADLSGALSRGTGILLSVMIVYKLYEDIAKHHAYDMHPALRKIMSPD